MAKKGSPGKGTYHIVTFGCQMNEHDSEVIAALLNRDGLTGVSEPAEADLLIINTCAVRRKPEDKVVSLLGRLRETVKSTGYPLIAVGGCMAQQEDVALHLRERFPHVRLIFGTHALPRLPRLLEEARNREGKGTIIDIEADYSSREGLPVEHGSSFRAWLPVTYGCNNYCSYCIVPHVRGRERSRRPGLIVKEAAELAGSGYAELTLLGQNVNSYGSDLPGNNNFAGLLARLDGIEGIKRIRFMTSHPKDLSFELISAGAEKETVCEHFHLPVQSGSNRILDRMNRRYSREHYLDLIREIRKNIPGVAITTDIIVGFPGEDEGDFRQTVELLKEARFDNAFSFIYSPRANTAAAALKDGIGYGEKEIRLQRLNDIQHKISREINENLVGKVVQVMVEGPSKTNPHNLTGRTRTNKLVHFPAIPVPPGALVELEVMEARTWNLVGEIIPVGRQEEV